jgi:purine-nucleoside phosphorylase
MGEKDKLIRSIEKNIILKELVVELRNLTDKTLVIFGSASEDFSKANDVDILTLDKNLNVNEIEKKLNLEVHVNYVSS